MKVITIEGSKKGQWSRIKREVGFDDFERNAVFAQKKPTVFSESHQNPKAAQTLSN
jgi:hypothetical protein